MHHRQCLAGTAAAVLIAASAYAQTPSPTTPPPPSASPHETGTTQPGFKRTPSPAGAYVYIGWPNDGQVLHTTHIKVWFGTRGFGVAPAGTTKANTGHHHLLIDVAPPPMDQPIPNDKNHLHFGLGQTETVIDLPPGTHTLQLLMGDADHVPHDPPLLSKKVTIRVVAAEGSSADTR